MGVSQGKIELTLGLPELETLTLVDTVVKPAVPESALDALRETNPRLFRVIYEKLGVECVRVGDYWESRPLPTGYRTVRSNYTYKWT